MHSKIIAANNVQATELVSADSIMNETSFTTPLFSPIPAVHEIIQHAQPLPTVVNSRHFNEENLINGLPVTVVDSSSSKDVDAIRSRLEVELGGKTEQPIEGFFSEGIRSAIETASKGYYPYTSEAESLDKQFRRVSKSEASGQLLLYISNMKRESLEADLRKTEEARIASMEEIENILTLAKKHLEQL